MCPGDSNAADLEILGKVYDDQRTPFDLDNADGGHWGWLRQTHVASIHEKALSDLRQSIQNTRNTSHGNFWGVITGQFGSGKTHLLKTLHEWMQQNRIFCVWIETYYGRKFLEAHLVYNVIDAMINAPGFSDKADGTPANILQEIAFVFLRKTLRNLLTSGDPSWPATIGLKKRIWPKIFGDAQQKEQARLLEDIESVDNLPAILDRLDISRLLTAIYQEYRSMVPDGATRQFHLLLEMAFTLDTELQRKRFMRLAGENQEDGASDEEEQEDAGVAGERSNLVSALCFLIAQSDIPVCLIMDHFESMYNHLKSVCMPRHDASDATSARKDLRVVINDILGGLERFFNGSRHISLLFTCQASDWEELSQQYLEDHTKRRIHGQYQLSTPAPEEIKALIKNRLAIFWQEFGYVPPHDLFPLDHVKVEALIHAHQRQLSRIFPNCLKEYRRQLAQKLGRTDGPETIPPQIPNFLVGKKCLQELEKESSGNLRRLVDVAGQIRSEAKRESDKNWLISCLERVRDMAQESVQKCNDILIKIPPSDVRKIQWRLLLKSKKVKVAELREYLENKVPIVDSSLHHHELIERTIETLKDDELAEFVRSCYSLTGLQELAKRHALPTYGSRDQLICRILRPYEFCGSDSDNGGEGE